MKFWNYARTFNAGEWIALAVIVVALAIVLWGSVGSAWSFITFSIQPDMPLTHNRNYDLIAQRSMAAASWFMVAVSFISASVAAYSLWLIRENLIEARLVRDAANRSADAAVAAVTEAQRTTSQSLDLGERQLRAYLLVERAHISIDHFGHVEAILTVANSGQSPARFVSADVDLWIELTEAGTGYESRALTQRIIMNDIKVGGGDTGHAIWSSTFTRWANQRALDYDVRFTGVLRYSDVFGHRRKENFQFQLSGSNVPHREKLELARVPDGNTMFED